MVAAGVVMAAVAAFPSVLFDRRPLLPSLIERERELLGALSERFLFSFDRLDQEWHKKNRQWAINKKANRA
jgi:hypothetical protein